MDFEQMGLFRVCMDLKVVGIYMPLQQQLKPASVTER